MTQIISLPLIIIFYYKVIINCDSVTGKNITDVGFFMKTFFFTLLDVSIALFLPLLCALRVTGDNKLGKIVTFISLISYSLYLFHPVMVKVMGLLFKNRSGAIIFIAIWVASITGAYVQYRFFEIYMTSFRDRFSKKKRVVTVI